VEYGGSGIGNNGSVRTVPMQRHGEAQSLELTLPPLATVYFRLAD
jgi:1,4-alpha-glucan branching enzyme